jgi:AraC-like DNA-binding protein
MDALSDLLRVLRFSSGVFLDATFRAPWCVHSQVAPEDCAPHVDRQVGLIAFHYVLDGQLQLALADEQVQQCAAGDLIVLADNRLHLIGSDLTLPPLRAEDLIRKAGELELARIDHGDGRLLLCRFVCGYLATTTRSPLLASLPALMVVPMRERACAEWVESSFRYAAHAHAERRAGTQEMLARLSELLFVEAVRDHIERLPAQATGWLAALRDPPLARALAALHAQAARSWTTDELAEQALLSRSAFAERFARTLGMPPMTYLTRWRMQLASQRLRESTASIARIASEIGYESESTFTRAFTRETGMPPGVYRRGGDRRIRAPDRR